MKKELKNKIKHIAFDLNSVLIESYSNIKTEPDFSSHERLQAFLKFLKTKKISAGILSNMRTDNELWVYLKGTKLFKPILLGGAFGLPKPHPRIYDEYIELSGFRPEEIMFIDNKRCNLIYMHTLGVTTVLLNAKKKRKNSYMWDFVDYNFDYWQELLNWLYEVL